MLGLPIQELALLTGFPAPLLDFDFVNGIYRQDAVGSNTAASNFITTSRASTGYADDISGNWTSFGNNVARITNKGLLVEEARTNSIRNNSMQGAAAGTPGTLPTNWSTTGAAGLTRTISLGTELGIDYIDIRYNGTSTGANFQVVMETFTSAAASQGQTWTESIFLKLVAGSFANVTAINITGGERNSGGTFLANFVTVQLLSSLTGTLQRFSGTGTTAQATCAFVNPVLSVNYPSGVAIDFTLRIGWPQLELGAFSTSPIRTTSAAVTRAADVVTAPYTLPNIVTGVTLFGEAVYNAPLTYTVNQFVIRLDDGTNNNRIDVYRHNTDGIPFMLSASGGSTIATLPYSTSITTGIVNRHAATCQVQRYIHASDGGQFFGNSNDGAFPVGITTLKLGSALSSVFLNGYLRRASVWNLPLLGVNIQGISR